MNIWRQESQVFHEVGWRASETEYVILQVDSDDSGHQNFGVAHRDTNNQALSPEVLIENIRIKLILVINSGAQGFYEAHAAKIVFAISVHDLECWLYAYYNTKALKKPKITGCYTALKYLDDQKVYRKSVNCKKITATTSN